LNSAATVYVPRVSLEPAAAGSGAGAMTEVENWPATLRLSPADLTERETYNGREYFVYHHLASEGESAVRYLVDDTGAPQFLVDPGINGTHRYTPDGQRTVLKFDAPKATLMSYIIKGILNRQLPWALVLLGVMIAVTLEMSGIPSLAFAVGVYLPLSSSTPIFIGGMVRWLADRHVRRKHLAKNLTDEQLAAESDKSPGVLMASGYIAGGAIAGILIAFVAGVPFMRNVNDALDALAAQNPFVNGPNADLLSCLPFVLLTVLLYLVGRELLLAPKRPGSA
jgi:hypothetical protein